MARLPAKQVLVFIATPDMLLAHAWVLFRPAHTLSWHLRVNSRCQASNTSYSLPCSTFTDVPIMPPRLVHFALFPITTLPLAGFIATLISLLVVVIVTTLVKSWKSCVTLELKFLRYLKKGARVLSNPLIELLFHGQICGVFVPFVDEIALSCHFALDSLCS